MLICNVTVYLYSEAILELLTPEITLLCCVWANEPKAHDVHLNDPTSRKNEHERVRNARNHNKSVCAIPNSNPINLRGPRHLGHISGIVDVLVWRTSMISLHMATWDSNDKYPYSCTLMTWAKPFFILRGSVLMHSSRFVPRSIYLSFLGTSFWSKTSYGLSDVVVAADNTWTCSCVKLRPCRIDIGYWWKTYPRFIGLYKRQIVDILHMYCSKLHRLLFYASQMYGMYFLIGA